MESGFRDGRGKGVPNLRKRPTYCPQPTHTGKLQVGGESVKKGNFICGQSSLVHNRMV